MPSKKERRGLTKWFIDDRLNTAKGLLEIDQSEYHIAAGELVLYTIVCKILAAEGRNYGGYAGIPHGNCGGAVCRDYLGT